MPALMVAVGVIGVIVVIADPAVLPHA